jgi:uncharacterized membrane protein YphA (DoxX/SURF4 family)
MKTNKIIYWATTIFFCLFQGLMPALFWNGEESVKSMAHLGYPTYFSFMLMIFKVVGCLAIIVPQVPTRLKEWAYGCFFIELIMAFWSNVAVDGLTGMSFFPLIILGILAVSYVYYHKLGVVRN